MFFQHRPWAEGHKIYDMTEHAGGVVEGWIGGEPVYDAPSLAQNIWTHVQLIPAFVQPSVYVRMTYNDEEMVSHPLYSKPVVERVSIVAARDEYGLVHDTVLGERTFDYQQEDFFVHIVERDGLSLINGQKALLHIPLGAVWQANPTPQTGVPLPHINQKGEKSVKILIKVDGKKPHNKEDAMSLSFDEWVRQGGLVRRQKNKVWVSDNIDIYRHPFGRIHWRLDKAD